MPSQTAKPILIIGAGLSGLALARLLTNANVPNIVFEASARTRDQGFSISLREWGYEALLEALGDVPLSRLTRGVAPDRALGGSGWIDQALRDNVTGETLVSPEPDKKQSIVRANRNALRAWLADCGDEEVDVRYEHELVSFTGQTGNLTAKFSNGSSYEGSLIVAADGVHSKVRSIILPEVKPDIVPVVVYHGEFRLSKADFDKIIKPRSGASNILAGVGDGFNTPITICNINNKHADLDWSYSRPITGEGDPLFRPNISTEEAKKIPPALLDEIASRNLGEPWSLFLNPEAMKSHHVFNWLSRCVFVSKDDVSASAEKNGIVFVGDSWHAMPIFGGEGGNHALVDACELAKALCDVQDVNEAVRLYYEGAYRRCQEAVRRSRGRFYLLHQPMDHWREIAEKRKVSAAD